MRVTNVRFCHNKIREFQYKWHLLRKKKLTNTGEKEYLESLGIKVVPAKEVLSEVVQSPK